MAEGKRVVVVGGVAGGATCRGPAASARRGLHDHHLRARSVRILRNCGLPYYVGNVIQREARLLLATPELFRERFRIDVHVESEVVSIDRERREVEVRVGATGRTWREPYDALVLATGAAPIRPPSRASTCPGSSPCARSPTAATSAAGSRSVRPSAPSSWAADSSASRWPRTWSTAGLTVSIVEMALQVLPPLDPEMAEPLHERLRAHGVTLHLGDGVAAFEQAEVGLLVTTQSGARLPADLVILAIGVRPEVALARRPGSSWARWVACASTTRCARAIRRSGPSGTWSR